MTLRRRVARLSGFAVALGVMAVSLVAVALWLAARTRPKLDTGRLPIGIDGIPSVSFFVAAGAVAAAIFVGLAALHAAAAMRVLARDRRIPPPLPRHVRKLRRLVLTPLGSGMLRLV